MKAVVTGMVATYAVGGVAWDYLQYALGLIRRGFDVFYLEDTGLPTYDPTRREYSADSSYGVKFLQNALERLIPNGRHNWHYRAEDGTTYGVSTEEAQRQVKDADLFLNVSGSCVLREEYLACRRKVLIDTDPGYNHFVNYPKDDAGQRWPGAASFRRHDSFLTYAGCIGQPDCTLPTFDLPWHPTRPLVMIDQWRAAPPAQRWTTVMTWNNFQRPIVGNDRTYGTKEREFAKIESLPSRMSVPLEIAVGGSYNGHLKSHGWSVLDSHSVSRTLDDYRDYIQQSRGELSVAKNVYVDTISGWFSCRSICYLAAGLPVVVQDTGFSRLLPTGTGLCCFTDLAGAMEGLSAVEADYDRHRLAARELARAYFADDVVLNDLLKHVGLG
jgi:hypothetical protein